MAELPFRVEQALLIGGRVPIVLAQPLGSADFTAADATLDGCRIRPTLQVPRTTREGGKARTDIFAFELIDAQDLDQFAAGQQVTLRYPG